MTSVSSMDEAGHSKPVPWDSPEGQDGEGGRQGPSGRWLMRWMKLEPIIQSEVSQKEKHQYSILTHIYGILKDGNDDLICETAKETQI